MNGRQNPRCFKERCTCNGFTDPVGTSSWAQIVFLNKQIRISKFSMQPPPPLSDTHSSDPGALNGIDPTCSIQRTLGPQRPAPSSYPKG